MLKRPRLFVLCAVLAVMLLVPVGSVALVHSAGKAPETVAHAPELEPVDLRVEVRYGSESLAPTPAAAPEPVVFEDRGSYSVELQPKVSAPAELASLSSGYGPRTCTQGDCGVFHKGVDYAIPAGSPVKSIAAGIVTFAGWDGDYGNKVVIEHHINGEAFTTVYGHMLDGSLAVHAGQEVPRGHQVGLVGDTGLSFGAHLHFEIHVPGQGPVNPSSWLAARDLAPLPTD